MFTNKSLEKNFLSPEEDNIKNLSELFHLFHETAAKNTFGARRHGNNKIIYEDIENWQIPHHGCDDTELSNRIKSLFNGGIRWHDPAAMLNVTPPPLYHAVAASTLATLYNQNALWDFTSGEMLKTERRIVAALGKMVANLNTCGGCFTSGGKAALSYALKIAINRAEFTAIDKGIKASHTIIASDKSHYSIEWVCNFLGIGNNSCIRIPSDTNGHISIPKLEETIKEINKNGRILTAIILLGGDTIDHIVDPVANVTELLGNLKSNGTIEKIPYIYMDAVNGWIWQAFKDYDFTKNELSIDEINIVQIKSRLKNFSGIENVDSFGIDLHKTGICPYSSSLFITKNTQELFSINGKGIFNQRKFGSLHAHHYTIENSRAASGIAAAWAMLNKIGMTGLRSYVASIINIRIIFERELINRSDDFFILPRSAPWSAVIFKPVSKNNYLWSNDTICKFHEYMVNRIPQKNSPSPQLGLVYYELTSEPGYYLLAYPMSLYSNKISIRAIIDAMAIIKREFEEKSVPSSNIKYAPRIPFPR